MKLYRSDRGFEQVEHRRYPEGDPVRLVSQSSIIGDYDDAVNRPGTSALWIGADHHLNREEVALLVKHLQSWVETGSLEIK